MVSPSLGYFRSNASAGVSVLSPLGRNSGLSELANAVGRVDLISTDVFDTLLLRTIRSQRSRIVIGERTFAEHLERHQLYVSPDVLVDARLEAQRLAFRALAVGESTGEVRLADIISRQLSILGLPQSLSADRLAVEVQVEKESLVANRALARILREHRRAGARIIAVSDTTLPSASVRDLIQHFHGADLIDAVYGSADCGRTKREGRLFEAVAQAEGVALRTMIHIGDDALADVSVPAGQGMTVHHLPRPRYLRHLRSADGAVTEAGRFVRAALRRPKIDASPAPHDAASFGRYVLGPIVTQFCILIWLYAAEAQADRDRKSVLLFCARGGIGIRHVFERTLDRLGLRLGLRRENLLISRLVAARAALLARSDAAVEELESEFKGNTFADVARALGGRAYDLSSEWHQLFRSSRFVDMLFGSTGAAVLADVQHQNALFTQHFRKVVGDADRIILCDTGLYGSTQRMLAAGFPDIRVETIQFARSNYKSHGEEHFPKVVGLAVEQNGYNFFNVKSCVLRYWHLIESLFEPDIPSVRSFAADEAGEVGANCGRIEYGVLDPSSANRLLSGAVSYIDNIPADSRAGGALCDAEGGWHRLRRAITRPGVEELQYLVVGGRSVDFGRTDIVEILEPRRHNAFVKGLRSLKADLWREGAIAREFPILKRALLPMFGLAQSLRGLLARQR